MIKIEKIASLEIRTCALSVSVNFDLDWSEAVNRSGPNTPLSNKIYMVGDLYKPTSKGTLECKIVLMSFVKGGSWQEAIAWAERKGLKRTDPRQVFAILEQKPQLHQDLEMDPMYIISTQECFFRYSVRICSVWWQGPLRGCTLERFRDLWDPWDWFAFLSNLRAC